MTRQQKRRVWVYLVAMHVGLGLVTYAYAPAGLFGIWFVCDTSLFALQARDLHRS